MNSPQIYPPVGSVWRHTNGNAYKVDKITNKSSTRHDEYPPTVVYHDVYTLEDWSKPACDWYRSRSLIHVGDVTDQERVELQGLLSQWEGSDLLKFVLWDLIRDIECVLLGRPVPHEQTTPEIIAQARLALTINKVKNENN